MQTSRRQFLTRSVASGVGLSVLGAQRVFAARKSSSQAFDEVYDVIVVGSGMSGTMAALVAAKAGARTLMIEKLNRMGGTSLFSNLDFACVGSDAQIAQGIEDSPEAMVKDMAKVAAGLADKERALNIAKHTAEAQKIMLEHGVKWKNLLKLGGHSTKRCLIAQGGGAGMLRSLWASFEKYPNLTVKTSTKLDDLIVVDGRVVGVAVRRNYAFNAALRSDDRENKTGQKRTYGARQGVIMATGGYSRDKEFIKDEVPYLEHTSNSNSEGTTSGALKTMMRIGARPVQLGRYRFSFVMPTEDFIWGVALDATTGKRYIAESKGRNAIALGSVLVRQNSGKMPFILYDEKAMAKFHNLGRVEKSMAGLRGRNGTMIKCDTLEELCQRFEADPVAVKETLKQYNAMIAQGKDRQFGKELERSGRKVEPIGQRGPFYGIYMAPFWDYSPGGILTDTKARALSLADARPIPGLWVVGEAAGGIHGAERLTACSMPDCVVTGMLAAQDVVTMKQKAFA